MTKDEYNIAGPSRKPFDYGFPFTAIFLFRSFYTGYNRRNPQFNI